ncbi:hypothetical protein [Kibdelosporangium philippinense]|uniref:hypothetical protein n=1 Tax=Kibdelosporangium philippinense TaxID=211113 RepID=UPI00360C161B
MSTILRVIAVFAATIAAVGSLTTAASATPGSGMSITVISQQSVGETNFVVAEVTLQPGGTTGWHYYDTPVVLQVLFRLPKCDRG